MKRLKLKTKILKNLICYHMTCINPKKSLSDDVSSLNLIILTDVLLYCLCPILTVAHWGVGGAQHQFLILRGVGISWVLQ